MNIDNVLERLNQSKFRARFKLSIREKQYINKVGLEKIKSHAKDFIRDRLAPSYIANDGKQTPMRGHPVFVAQHACACCCRDCLYKWHGIIKGITLSESQQDEIIDLLMTWIEKQYRK